MYHLDKSRNCVFSLQYHFISVIKYRQQVFINDEIISDTKNIMSKIAKDFDVNILEIECGVDHVHIVFRSKPTLDMIKFINILKGHSSRDIRKKHSDFLNDKLWGDNFWSPSYFISTTGNVTLDVLQEYVKNQRKLQK